jgi:cell division initiation protein
MKITPLDIQQQQFTVRFRGFDTQEVDTFLESVANELEEQIKKNNDLREDLERKEARIWEYQNMEKTLKETLLMAQATAEEMRKNAQSAAEDLRATAQREAALAISRAREQAEKVMAETNAWLTRIQAEYNDLKRRKTIVEQELRSLLETNLKLLDASTTKHVAEPEDENIAADSGLFKPSTP